MKYGVYFAYWENEWDTDFEPYIEKVKNLGFDVLEVAALGLVSLPDSKLRRLKELAAEHEVLLTAGIGLPKQYDVSSSDASVRAEGIAFMKKVMDAMHKAGIDRVGGTIYSYWPADYSGPVDKETARRHSIESMQELARYAKQYDIILLVETLNRFEQFLLNDAQEAMRYVEEVNEPNVKVMLDTFHMNIEEDNIADALRLAGRHLGHLHIGEANRKVPGKGSIPWQEIGDALREIDYTGYVVMEPFVKTGGQVGRDIRVWRELSADTREEQLDRDLAESLVFVKEKFGR
ncbi:D-psicose 3-epimerase [Edaphobacillus lindanitolerans]|uniref:D-tagatose 3-epimerase n=1 Tax=Edaphobacillus lindanitolerans TaxID=550447 RepID=A0A1U7PKH0_9BACI|nr:sugar phosphate isomerase/epimerase family protein [Edaphobacillus lindanitolerans]SIT73227.1 D-tagatose 3-epimerase [Edaphobacillus lindanitolerans]